MKSLSMNLLLGILIAIGLLSCADKIVTDTTYEDKFSVPIQNSGLPDSLSIDSVKVILTTAVSNEKLWDTTFHSLFVYMGDPTFIYRSTDRVNLVYSYQVYADGKIILWSEQTILSDFSSGTKLEVPEIADSATIAAIKEKQNTAETELSFRTNPDHEECVEGFSPNPLTAIGTKTKDFSVIVKNASNCTFLGWSLDLEGGGSANLTYTTPKVMNSITVSGAKGYIVAEFLLPGEALSSVEQGTSSLQSSSGTSSSDTLTSSSSASTTMDKTLRVKKTNGTVKEYTISEDKSITIEMEPTPHTTISGWDTIPGVIVEWVNGSDSTWNVSIDYSEFNPTPSYVLTFIEKALTNTIDLSANATWPGCLYPGLESDKFHVLNLDASGSSFTLVDFSIKTDGTATSSSPRTFNLPNLITVDALFKNRVALGKHLYEYGTIGLLGNDTAVTMNVIDVQNASNPEITLDLFVASSGIPKAFDYWPDGSASIVAAYQVGTSFNISTYVGGNQTPTSTTSLAPNSGSNQIYEMNDIALASTTAGVWAAVIKNDNSIGTNSLQTVVFGSSTETTPTIVETGSAGTLISIIPSEKSENSFYAFGNLNENRPEVIRFGVDQKIAKNARLPLYQDIPMEFIGGRELGDGRILAWGTNVGAYQYGTKALSNVTGVIALFDSNLNLIWKKIMPGQLPFGAIPNKDGTFFVSTLSDPVSSTGANQSQLFHVGVHGEY